jgi:hypothetical protein
VLDACYDPTQVRITVWFETAALRKAHIYETTHWSVQDHHLCIGISYCIPLSSVRRFEVMDIDDAVCPHCGVSIDGLVSGIAHLIDQISELGR